MARLNKHRLTNDQTEELFLQLSTSISRLSASRADTFLSQLLGPEEKIMVAKRLGAIILLSEGTSMYKVSQVLKVSTGTAERIKTKIQGGEFDELLSIIKSHKKQYLSILQTLDTVLHFGGIMPHRTGLDRYKMLRK